MSHATNVSNGQRGPAFGRENSLAVSPQDINTALEDGENSRVLMFNQLAGDYLLKKNLFLREFIEDGYKISEQRSAEMTSAIQEMVKSHVAFTPKQLIESLKSMANKRNLEDSQRGEVEDLRRAEVTGILLQAFIEGVDKSLQEKVSAHRDELSRYR